MKSASFSSQFNSLFILYISRAKPFKLGLHVKARSHDPLLRIRFLVPKTGSRRSDGPISRFRFCGENVGRSFVVCSHDPFFRTNKESSIRRQNDPAKFFGAFHLSRRVSDENRTCSISIRFFFQNYGSV